MIIFFKIAGFLVHYKKYTIYYTSCYTLKKQMFLELYDYRYVFCCEDYSENKYPFFFFQRLLDYLDFMHLAKHEK